MKLRTVYREVMHELSWVRKQKIEMKQKSFPTSTCWEKKKFVSSNKKSDVTELIMKH